MRAALSITLKDLRSRLRDRSAYIVAIVAPLVLAVIFTFVFGSTGSDPTTFAFGVVDSDGDVVAATFTDDVLGDLENDGTATVASFASVDDARQALEDGETEAVFVIPPGFTDAVRTSRPAAIEVLGDVDAQISTQAARSIALAFAASLEQVQATVHALVRDGQTDRGTAVQIAQEAATRTPPIALGSGAVADKELGSAARNSAGMAVMFLFFTVQFGVIGYLEERRDGTLTRLLAAPVSKASILGGKALTSIVMGALSMTVLLIVTTVLLGADYGSALGVAVLVAAGILAAVSVTIVVAALAKTAEQAGNWQSMVAVLLAMFGGAFFPLSQSPDWMLAVSRLTPHAWFLSGLGDLAAGGTITDIVPAAGAMLAFAAVCLLLGAVPLRRAVLR